MSDTRWTVTFRVFRQKENQAPHYDDFEMRVDPDEYVLDGVERIWAYNDRSLCYRHACHHSTCGACGMRVNGVEKLTCITLIRDVTRDGGLLRIDPLRNFPVVSDLVVDMSTLYSKMDVVQAPSVLPVIEAEIEKPPHKWDPADREFIRLADCLECGLCVSACPIADVSSPYLGPAALAGAQQVGVKHNPDLLRLVDCEAGVWRCHSAFECTEVCPSFVDPGRRIMHLRWQVVTERYRRIFNRDGVKQAR